MSKLDRAIDEIFPVPAKAGKRGAVAATETERTVPPVSKKPAQKAGKTKACQSSETIKRTPSSSSIPRKRARPACPATKSESTLPVATNSVGHIRDEIHLWAANGTGRTDQAGSGNHVENVSAALSSIALNWRMRQRWHRAEKALILQAKAMCRAHTNGDKDEANALYDAAFDGDDVPAMVTTSLIPFLPAIKEFRALREQFENDMAKTARVLPTYEWATAFKGLGAGSFVSLIGETSVIEEDGSIRSIGDYRSVAALWKRMGLAVIDGGRQRKVADAEAALVHGYSPSRRSVAWNIGCSLIGGMGRGPRPAPGEDIDAREDWTKWQKMFVARCRYECERNPEKSPLKVVANEKKGDLESYTKFAQARAKRYVEKKFLRDLFARWRFETTGEVIDPETAWMNTVPQQAEGVKDEAGILSQHRVRTPSPSRSTKQRKSRVILPVAAE